jgi:hypothetical protein
MDFNFRDSFQAYSNVELLRIIDEADKYQPEAVEAARHILGGREVHDSDYEQANGFKVAQKEGVRPGEESLSDFLESIIEREIDPKVIRLVNILYIVLTLYYVWILLSLIQPLDAFQQCEDCSVMSPDFFSMTYPVIYLPLAVFLMIRRKRLGWFLLTGFLIVRVLANVIDIAYYSYLVKDLHTFNYWPVVEVAIFMAIRAGIVLALYKPGVAAYFNVGERARRNTLIISVSIGIVLSTFAALWLFAARYI